jgi:iron complex transport system permease protein
LALFRYLLKSLVAQTMFSIPAMVIPKASRGGIEDVMAPEARASRAQAPGTHTLRFFAPPPVERQMKAGLPYFWQKVLESVNPGASLGSSGAAMQGLFRNPLAEPYLLGVASGASFGATVAMTFTGQLALAFAEVPFAPSQTANLVPMFAFMGAIGAVFATLALTQARSRSKTPSILLAGIVVGSVLTSLTTYLMMRDADRLRAVFSWALGNLAASSWTDVARAAPYAAAGMLCLFALARGLDALQLGDDTARTLGVDTQRVRVGVIVGASLSTAAAVSFVGIIGFVGLAAPHIMRRLGAVNHRALLPASGLAGATLLVLADLVARVLIRPAELPVGIVTTLVGGPFFLWLLRRQP